MTLRIIDYTNTIEEWYGKYNELATDVGSLVNLSTVAKGSVVEAANELESNHNALDTWVGARSFAFSGSVGISTASVQAAVEDIWNDLYTFLNREAVFSTVSNTVVGAVNELESNHNALDARVGALNLIPGAIREADITSSIDSFYDDYIAWAAPATLFNTTAQTATGALNELHGQHDALDARVGPLSTLALDIRGASYALSMNLLDTKFENWTGFGTALTTSATNLSGAVNELESNHNALDTRVGALSTIHLGIRGSSVSVSLDNFYDAYLAWAAPGTVLTTAAQTATGAINELESNHNALDTRVGALSTIRADIRGASVVASFNSVDTKFMNWTGFGTTLGTASTNLAGAINELHGEVNTNAAGVNATRSAISGSVSSASITGINNAIEGASIVATFNNFYTQYATRTDVGTTLNTTASTLGAAINELHGIAGIVPVLDRDAINLQALHYRVGNLSGLNVGFVGAANDSLVDAINFVYDLQTGETVEFTNASITGTLGVGGAATFDTSLTVQGAFTSRGIDDNATGIRLQIENALITAQTGLQVNGTVTSTGALNVPNILIGSNGSINNNAGERVEFSNLTNEINFVVGAATRLSLGTHAIEAFRRLDALAGINVTGTLNVGGAQVFHPGNMGSGSNLDADKLDGVQLSQIARTDINEVFNGSLTVQGNLIVNGTTTTINTTQLNISDNIVVLNNDVTGAPTENAGLEIERGTSTNVSVRWNETSDYWDLTNNGINFYRILTTADEGPGNNLDADTLDGQHGSFYSNYNNLSNKPTIGNATIVIGAGTGLSGGGTFTTNQTGNGTINLNVSNLTVAQFAAASIQFSTEGFVYTNNAIMSAAAIQDKILSYGYTGNVGTITGVTAGGALTGGGSSGTVTINHADTSSQGNVSTAGKTVVDDFTFDGYGHVTGVTTRALDFYTTGEANARYSLLGHSHSTADITSGVFALARIPSIPLSSISAGSVQTNVEGFVYTNGAIMTAAAIEDRITGKGYTSNVGDITGVTAGAGLTGGGASGTVTLNHADTSAQGNVSTNGKTVVDDFTFDGYGHVTGVTTRNLDFYTTGEANARYSLLSHSHSTADITSGVFALARIPAIPISGILASDVQTSSEPFSYTNGALMTAAAIQDKILSYGYGQGDITGVTAGGGLTGGGSSGTVTINHADTSAAGSVNNSGGTVIQDITLDGYGHLTSIGSVNLDGRYLLSGSADTKTAGALTFNSNVYLNFGTSNGFSVFHNGAHAYMDMNLGNLYIRDGITTRFTFADNGAFTATGDITAFSDMTLKKNLVKIKDPLEGIRQFSGLYFHWNDAAKKRGLDSEERQIGVIAQEVERVYPEAVVTEADGIKKVKYDKLVPVLLEAIKSLAEKVEALENA